MSWELFIDDERFPVHACIHYPVVVARNSYDAIRFIEAWGIPHHIYFDHDLGGKDTAMVVVNWIENYLLDSGKYLPANFSFSVHSMNPVGAENIKSKMYNIVDHLGG